MGVSLIPQCMEEDEFFFLSSIKWLLKLILKSKNGYDSTRYQRDTGIYIYFFFGGRKRIFIFICWISSVKMYTFKLCNLSLFMCFCKTQFAKLFETVGFPWSKSATTAIPMETLNEIMPYQWENMNWLKKHFTSK